MGVPGALNLLAPDVMVPLLGDGPEFVVLPVEILR